jgi:hypothetical protein
MLRALGDIAFTTPDREIRRMLYERGKRIVDGCAEKLGEEDIRPMRTRLARLEKLLAETP